MTETPLEVVVVVTLAVTIRPEKVDALSQELVDVVWKHEPLDARLTQSDVSIRETTG